MSNFIKKTKHPVTGEWEFAEWCDNYFAHHEYGVIFKDGSVFRPKGLETKNEYGEYKRAEDGRLTAFGPECSHPHGYIWRRDGSKSCILCNESLNL